MMAHFCWMLKHKVPNDEKKKTEKKIIRTVQKVRSYFKPVHKNYAKITVKYDD